MTRKQLLRRIDAHLKRTEESAYAFGKRVLGDKAFVWKMRNSVREPWPRTVTAILKAIRLDRSKKVNRSG